MKHRDTFLIGLAIVLSLVSCANLWVIDEKSAQTRQTTASSSKVILPGTGEADPVSNDLEIPDMDAGWEIFFSDFKDVDKFKRRGEYLTRGPSACGFCHGVYPTNPNSPLSGGALVTDSLGELRAPNLTPDKKTGIGRWSIREVMDAIRAGNAKDGGPLSFDVHKGYRWMSDLDALSIAVYLFSQEPVSSSIPRREMGVFDRNSLGIIPKHEPWRGYIPALPETVSVGRGRYVVSALNRCASCHSSSGLLDDEWVFSGSSEPATKRGEGGPDIRSRGDGSLTKWSDEDWDTYFASGSTPGGKTSSPNLCPWSYFGRMNAADKKAVILYLKKGL